MLASRFPFAHTYSIVAYDKKAGQMGVAVQSHWFSVGSVVAWGEAGVGVVATQSITELSYGPLGLTLMRAGKTPQQALDALLVTDEARELRQVAMLNAQGQVAVHTGQHCIADAGHESGPGFSVQANMMATPRVWPAMAHAYQAARGNLAERMLQALEAAQKAGGDIRGKQNACLLVVNTAPEKVPWGGRVMDLRVEDHPEPLTELRRLIQVQHAYQYMNEGDKKLGQGNVEEALAAYQKAAQLAPQITELPFWQAVTLADLGRMPEALSIFREVFTLEPEWATLVQRLPASGLLRDNAEMMKQILSCR